MSYCLYALALKFFELFLVNFDCSSDCLGARLRVPETHLVLFKKNLGLRCAKLSLGGWMLNVLYISFC